MRDRRVQCFVGSGSTMENLRLISRRTMPFSGRLTASDREKLLEGFDGVLSPVRQEAIWNMLWRRWSFYESLCDEVY